MPRTRAPPNFPTPGIKAIKLYAWEEPYLERISALRERELRAIRKTQLLGMVRAARRSPGAPGQRAAA
jgi:hypothetical protein